MPSDPIPIDRFGGVWAKIELFLGLFGTGVGLMLGNWQTSRPAPEIEWSLLVAALALFVFGGYLTLAGHRSHLYRSNLMVQAELTRELQRSQDSSKG